MFSGKSTELHRRLRRYEIGNKKSLLFKHGLDLRYNRNIDITKNNDIEDKDLSFNITHDKNTYIALSCKELIPNIDKINDVDVIGIDEGQFFPDIVEFVELCANKGKIVLIAGLSGSFERNVIGDLYKLLPKAEQINMLTAVCKCGKDAQFTKKFASQLNEKVIVEIGGKEKYTACCRECYFKI